MAEGGFRSRKLARSLPNCRLRQSKDMDSEINGNSMTDKALWERYASQFPVRERLTYLNDAAVSPLRNPPPTP